MSSRRFHVEYAPLAVENLRAVPKTVASQIVRKISRLELGLHGNIKRLRQADFGYPLTGADLVGANLKDADIAGADLSNVHGLTLEQLKSTYGYGKATLPDYLEMAVQSEGETE